MYAVGRLGSYITQGVYTVSGPFHPFGGAVDMVVVQQQDGSLKSSPWYVRFGKFQGVLKAKERVVDINVNGLDADFHMYLDPRGEAYFLREIDSEEVVETVSSHSSSHEEMNGKGQDMITVKTKSMNYDFDQCNSVNDVSNGEVLSRTNSKRSRILGFVLGRRSMKEHIISKEENNSNVGRMGSLESAEIAADLLEMRWSTNLSSIRRDSRNDNEDITGGRLEGSLVLHEQHFVNKLESSGVNHEVPAMEVKETIVADVVHDVNENVDEEVPSMEVKETIIADIVHDVNENGDEEVPSMEVKETIVADVRDVNENIDEEVPSIEVKETIVADVHNDNETVDEERLRTQLDDSKEAEVGLITAQGCLEIVPESYTEVASNQGDTSLEVVACNSIAVPICQNVNDNLTKEVNETNEIRAPMKPNGEFHDVSADSVLMEQVNEEFVEEHLIFGDLDESKPSINQVDQEVKQGGSESMSITYGSDSLTVRTYQEPFKDDVETVKGNIRRCPTNLDIPKSCQVTEAEVGRQAKSLPNMWCQFNDPVPENHEETQFYSPVGKFRSSNWDLLREDASMIKKANLEKELPLHADNLSKDLKDGSISSGGAPNIVDGAGGSWRLWPFTRLGSKNVTEKEQDSKKDSVVDNLPETDGEKEEISPKSDKTHTRALTPTPEQLASLNLAEGQNSVTFTFSTSVLGPQKVDARIYLWRWDSRIVISDVDGTITKSDVLGQFMPLVGRDWSHIGVTHLFSAIKENGYQMLYLSARAISQASITRQFLFNLKQDGKALPDGPVVISPDGLFPSLFREVIRRAPHEFKIACLEDIKACFPPDRNPFYAGFGNRDTDEFSYLKVGIPKGKIFIINPKGEVVINRCIDSKSYASLHALVNGIFPPISVQEEQEDYNSWNFWKLPPPTID